MKPFDEYCGNCKFHKNHNEWFTECRRHAPTVHLMGDGKETNGPHYHSKFPEVSRNNWCGDYEKEQI